MKFFKHIFLFALFFASTDVFGILPSPICDEIRDCFAESGYENPNCCRNNDLGDYVCEDYYYTLYLGHGGPDYDKLCYACDPLGDPGTGKQWNEMSRQCECMPGYSHSDPDGDGLFDCEPAPIKLQYQTNCSGTPEYNSFYVKFGGICTQEHISSCDDDEWSTSTISLTKDWRCEFKQDSAIDDVKVGGKGTVDFSSVSSWISLTEPDADPTYTIDTGIAERQYNVYFFDKDSYSQTCTFFKKCRLPPYKVYLTETGEETGGSVIKGYKLTNMSNTPYQNTLTENVDISNLDDSMDKNNIGWIITLVLEPCPANHYCPSGTTPSGTTGPIQCPPGTFSDAGSDNISNCEIRGGQDGTKFCDNVGCFYLPDEVKIPTKE